MKPQRSKMPYRLDESMHDAGFNRIEFFKIIFRAIVMCVCGFALVPLSPSAALASHPNVVPSYTHTADLRDDASLQAVAFADDSLGLAVGDHGTILRTIDGGATWQIQTSGIDVRLDDIVWISPRRCLAVGGTYDKVTGISRAVVVTSHDAGQTWQNVDTKDLPRLRTVAVRQDQRTLVATGDYSVSSMTREFESHDAGRTWVNGGELDGPVNTPTEPSASELRRWTTVAKINTPIRDACRIGDSDLCAVGDHGVITLSRDRGKTWQTVRGENRHCAILFFVASPATAPWPMVGNESLEMQHRSGILLCNRPTPTTNPVAVNAVDLARQAAAVLGASCVDSLDAGDQSPGDLRANHSRSTLSRSADADKVTAAIESWMVIHRPSLIVIDESLDERIRQTITSMAIAWKVKRIVSYSFGNTGDSIIHCNGMVPGIGALHRDLWQDALHVVAPARTMPSTIAIRQQYDVSSSSQRGESLLAGLPIDPAQKRSTNTKTASRRQLQIVQGRLAQPKRIANLVRTSRTDKDFSIGIRSILDQTPQADQFRLAWSVLQNFQSDPRFTIPFQIAMLRVIAERFDSHSAGKWAALRLKSIEGGSEWTRLRLSLSNALASTASMARWRVDAIGGSSQPASSDSSAVAQASEIVAVSPFQTPESRVVQASATAPLVVPPMQRMHQKSSTQPTNDVDLLWEFHPLVLIARNAAQQRGDEAGLHAADEEDSNGLRRLSDDQRILAWTKLTTVNRKASPAIIAKRTNTPPRLDGKLTESFWQLPALARAGEHRKPQLAYDDNYVYIAMQCPAGEIRPDDLDPKSSDRVRDHHLQTTDRLELAFDIDHDLMTQMQFAVTDSGRTHDAIDGHRQFDPTWYIATDRTPTWVTFEMAIQRRDMTELPIVPGQSWLLKAGCRKANSQRDAVMPNPDKWTRIEFR